MHKRRSEDDKRLRKQKQRQKQQEYQEKLKRSTSVQFSPLPSSEVNNTHNNSGKGWKMTMEAKPRASDSMSNTTAGTHEKI